MRKERIAPGEYYHIYNRGNNKQQIFIDNRDYIRFLFLIVHLQSPAPFYNIGRQVAYFVRHRVFNIERSELESILKDRYVELVNFALMPNHFHLIVKERKENGISRYMQRVLNAHTKYFNTKYKKSGHLFQGPFQIVHIQKNKQLLYLSSYIHRNPREIKEWKNREHEYIWSSYKDYISENRWGDLIKTDIILNQFSNSREYKNFVKTSTSKTQLSDSVLLD